MKVFFVLTFLLLLSLKASVSQGEKIFTQECIHCHSHAKHLASGKKAVQWKKLLQSKNKKNTLAQHHLNSDDNTTSFNYFQTQKYQEDIPHLKAFFQKYSKDRGRHNSCN